MKHYCHNCETFCEPATDVEYVTSEFWGSRITTAHEFNVCPTCGADVEEQVACTHCDSTLPVSGYDECGPCLLILEDQT